MKSEVKPEAGIVFMMDVVFLSYFTPGVVLGIAVSSGRGTAVSLAINSRLKIIDENPEER